MRALAGVALALPVAAIYPLVLWQQIDDPWAFVHAEDRWHRHFSHAGPLGGIWDALTRWTPSGAGVNHAIAVNAEALAFLVLFVVLTVIVWRRFGAAYGLFGSASATAAASATSAFRLIAIAPRAKWSSQGK